MVLYVMISVLWECDVCVDKRSVTWTLSVKSGQRYIAFPFFSQTQVQSSGIFCGSFCESERSYQVELQVTSVISYAPVVLNSDPAGEMPTEMRNQINKVRECIQTAINRLTTSGNTGIGFHLIGGC